MYIEASMICMRQLWDEWRFEKGFGAGPEPFQSTPTSSQQQVRSSLQRRLQALQARQMIGVNVAQEACKRWPYTWCWAKEIDYFMLASLDLHLPQCHERDLAGYSLTSDIWELQDLSIKRGHCDYGMSSPL